jgi:hypothetical protein
MEDTNKKNEFEIIDGGIFLNVLDEESLQEKTE